MKRFLFILAICLPGIGCIGLANVARVNIVEPSQFGVGKERHATFRRNRDLAEWAWATLRQNDQCSDYSGNYKEGFLDGYSDYLNLGGTGAAPPLPPRRYWNTRYKTPAGQQAIEDWFAGFEHGASEAKQSGFREAEIVPSSLLCGDGACGAPGPMATEPMGAPAPATIGPLPPPGSPLPAPPEPVPAPVPAPLSKP
jgi:hypothetical protein